MSLATIHGVHACIVVLLLLSCEINIHILILLWNIFSNKKAAPVPPTWQQANGMRK